jgi:acylphosphatase
MNALRVTVRIRGRVQGVFFRESARQEAVRLSLTGWVRNCDDGSVEGVAEGTKEAVAQWVSWCKKGPPAARVVELEMHESKATGEFSRFAVEH